MNSKVEFKLMRNILSCKFNSYQKKESLENIYFRKADAIIDLDSNSIFEIFNKIKSTDLKMDEAFIINTYNSIFPTLRKVPLNENKLKILMDYLAINHSNMEKCFVFILKNDVFYGFSYIMAIIIFNYFFYKEKNIFLSIGYSYEYDFYLAINKNNDILVNNLFSSIYKINDSYHKKRFVYKISNIKSILTSVLQKHSFDDIKVYAVYLFGSYSRSLNNEYSDIDFHFEIESKKGLTESAVSIKLILSDHFNSNIDVKTSIYGQPISKEYQDMFKGELLIYSI